MGIEGTTVDVCVNGLDGLDEEQGGSGPVAPQRPVFPAKDDTPYLARMDSGTLPESWLLETLKSVRFGMTAERSGRGPERRLSCRRSVRRWVREEKAVTGGIGPERLLPERSRRSRR